MATAKKTGKASSKAKGKGPLSKIAATMHEGGLHESLGIPKGQKIPPSKIAAAASKPGKVGRQARLAQTFAKFRKGGKKKS